MGDVYFLDANVLMYAAGTAHALKEPCQRALTRAVENGVELVTDAEVLQEILHRYFSLARPAAARTVYQIAVRVCGVVLPIRERDTTRALELLEEHPRLSPRDAIHVATMEHRELTFLLSTDADFDGLPQIERVPPDAFVG
jgi:predicted nucleic acid-binding protein